MNNNESKAAPVIEPERSDRDPGEDAKKVLANLRRLDRELWLGRVERAFEKKRKISAAAKRDFGERLLSEIASIVAVANLVIAENSAVKDVLSKLEKLSYYTDSLKRSKDELGFLYIADKFSSQTLAKKHTVITLEQISDYFELIQIYVNMSQEVARKAGRKNGKQMAICHFICKAYEYYLGEKPTFSDADYINLAGSHDAGTPYEHVCKLIEEILPFEISWSTMRKASETYQDGGISFMTLSIDSEDKELMKSLQKFF